jgi:protein-S-isoprenylcysteine O-methyltransferase Ste14
LDNVLTRAYAYGLWSLVIFNILFLLIFVAAFFLPRKKAEWRSLGIFAGFLVALFTEMYGFPLTIYIIITIFGKRFIPDPFTHLSGNLWASLIFGRRYASVFMGIGTIFIFTGLTIIGIGWRQIFRAKNELVTTGIYRHVRHPQYTGLIIIIIGTLVQWPTFITIFMSPILVGAYIRLAKKEEKDLESKFGTEFLEYKNNVPAFLPRITIK